MKVRAIAGLAALAGLAGLAGLAFLLVYSAPPGQVALSAHDAYERLANGDLTDFVFQRQCGILVHVKTETSPDQSVTWHIKSSGREMLSFTAMLAPVDDRDTGWTSRSRANAMEAKPMTVRRTTPAPP
jgi:hypothetical protein